MAKHKFNYKMQAAVRLGPLLSFHQENWCWICVPGGQAVCCMQMYVTSLYSLFEGKNSFVGGRASPSSPRGSIPLHYLNPLQPHLSVCMCVPLSFYRSIICTLPGPLLFEIEAVYFGFPACIVSAHIKQKWCEPDRLQITSWHINRLVASKLLTSLAPGRWRGMIWSIAIFPLFSIQQYWKKMVKERSLPSHCALFSHEV